MFAGASFRCDAIGPASWAGFARWSMALEEECRKEGQDQTMKNRLRHAFSAYHGS
jgi:hypothetical protein